MGEKIRKVAIVGIVGLPAKYGGFETLVENITEHLHHEFEITVYCQNTLKENQLKKYNGVTLKYLPFKANGLQSIIYDITAITKSWFKFDTILILGTPGSIILPILKLFRKTKTVINFGGLEWKRDKWNKLVLKYLKLTESVAIKHATIIIADNQFFCDYIKDNYNKESCLIEYGGDHVINQINKHNILVEKYPFVKCSYHISVSRAQPDNNLHLLLNVYSKQSRHLLVLISNFENFEYGRLLKEKYKDSQSVIMIDAIYDQKELDFLRSNAEIYIHSHSFCGTAPSLVEAMSLSLPIISFDVPTNRFTTENKALYFKDENDLTQLLKDISDNDLTLLRKSMKEIAERRYQWKRIKTLYSNFF